MQNDSAVLLSQIKQCDLCEASLPFPPRPVFQYNGTCSVVIIGQAPGIKAHDSNKPWNDASGVRLRKWLGLTENVFYDTESVAIIPMGFCYPGKGKSGDLPPRPECAPKWHDRLICRLPTRVTFLIGQYAQNYYLKDNLTLTERVNRWQEYQPEYFVLPHPSPRNNIWLKRNAWFEQEVVPKMQDRVRSLLNLP